MSFEITGFLKPPFEKVTSLVEAESLVLDSVPPSFRGNLQNLLRVYHNTLVHIVGDALAEIEQKDTVE